MITIKSNEGRHWENTECYGSKSRELKLDQEGPVLLLSFVLTIYFLQGSGRCHSLSFMRHSETVQDCRVSHP